MLREEMGAVFERLDEINRIDNEAAKAALQQQGITFVMPNPGEIERWREISAKSVDDMVEHRCDLADYRRAGQGTLAEPFATSSKRARMD